MIRGMHGREAAREYAVFDAHSHEVRIASAGMPGPFHLSAKGCQMLELSGIPPGLFAGTSYEMLTLRLKPGDSVFFCTDGLTDAFDRRGEQFGIARLHELFCPEPVASPEGVLGRALAARTRF